MPSESAIFARLRAHEQRFESDETRLERIETALIDLTTSLTPSVASIEQSTKQISRQLHSVEADVKACHERLADGSRKMAEQNIRIQHVENLETGRQKTRRNLVIGILVPLVVAVAVTFFGIR